MLRIVVISLSFIRFQVTALASGALVALALTGLAGGAIGAEAPSPATAPAKADETNTQDTLRAYLYLQEQLHATQLALERNQHEAEAAAAENARALSNRLQGIEQVLLLQRTQELEAMRSSNRAMRTVALLVLGLGFVAMLFMAYFQWRTINHLGEMSATLPVAHALGAGSAIAALGPGEVPVVAIGPAQQSSQRLIGALERLEKRIYHLEHTPSPPLHEGSSPVPADAAAASTGPPATTTSPDADGSARPARIAMLLGKGQALLSLDKAEEAAACFDQALALDPNHPEALVKKGAALERLRKLDEAIACYDRAIVADNSMTVAYLYKGGLFNRMERFGEALECYEQALRTQEARRG